MRAIIDSDILIDYLRGIEKAKGELDRYSQAEISIVSWMEIMTGPQTPEEAKTCLDFLASFRVHQLSMEIANEAVALRRKFHVRLPDAIIWATARVNDCMLVTRNTKDFPSKDPGIRIPYCLQSPGKKAER